MTDVRTPNELLDEVVASLSSTGTLQVSGTADVDLQILLLGLLNQFSNSSGEFRRKFVVVFPKKRDFANWLSFFSHVESQFEHCAGAVLPSLGFWGNDRLVNQSISIKQRVHSLSLFDSGDSAVVFTTLKGLAQKTMARRSFFAAGFTLSAGEEWDQDTLRAKFVDLGYLDSKVVDEEGEFAIRGGIIDIFPPQYQEPIRIEFFGDEISAIRSFSVDSQRSTHDVESLRILPASEYFIPAAERETIAQRLYDYLLSVDIDQHDRDGMLRAFLSGMRFPGFDLFASLYREENVASFEFLNSDDVLLFPKPIESCLEDFDEFWQDNLDSFAQDQSLKRPSFAPDNLFVPPDELRTRLERVKYKLEFGNPYVADEQKNIRYQPQRLAGRSASLSGTELFDTWAKVFKDELAGERGICILSQQDSSVERLQSLLAHRDFKAAKVENLLPRIVNDTSSLRGVISVGIGELSSPTYVGHQELLVVPEHALLGQQKRKAKPASKKLQNYLSSFKELKIGGLVVHIDHGIGRYLGLENLTIGGSKGDYLVLEYSGGDKVYLPVDRLSLLQRYNTGSDQKTVAALDKLKGQSWQKRKARVRGAVRDMADELLMIQAERQLAKGTPFSAAGEDYYQFEAEFPYTETDDQARAIADVNADMSAAKPMDRLICGDVGFGKTEVALRATYRAVLSGYQVLILVPTTVLCYQHYRTLKGRLEKHGLNIAQVNRFVKGVDLKLALQGLKNGKVDVLVGTHRLLSKDIEPKRLGLLIVDEEQRFGVGHKEKLKSLKAGCDVLTLTATPIPRTLHMSMLGLRDISIIATPPHDRLSTRTYVAKFDELLVKEAIEREVARGGQVFFVHNRVEDIVETTNFVKSLVPQVEVRFAHGQMGESKLEKVIVDFIEQKFSVLVCTTIIESGVDMPNVNTLIVDRADKFGLAQLYQIRGRVGRSTRQAYAYFMTPAREKISEEALQRLDVLSTYQELGSGFQIASHDLEIRGAGNLLGGEQSGRVAEVGLELYTEMLEQAIQQHRGKSVKDKVDTEIRLPITTSINRSYIPEESHRLEIYKRLFSIDSREELDALKDETKDRFGSFSKEMELLFKIGELKFLLRLCRASVIQENRFGEIDIKFGSLEEAQIGKMIEVAQAQPNKYKLSPDYRLILNVEHDSLDSAEKKLTFVGEVVGLLEPLALAMEGMNEV